MFNKQFSITGYLQHSIKSALKFTGGLLILATCSQFVYAETKDQYELPPNKHYMELCEREALQLHSGMIEEERIFHQQDKFWVRYDIQATDNSEWSVLCDLTTGKVIREQKRVDDKL